jgi:hypothetical protein
VSAGGYALSAQSDQVPPQRDSLPAQHNQVPRGRYPVPADGHQMPRDPDTLPADANGMLGSRADELPKLDNGNAMPGNTDALSCGAN